MSSELQLDVSHLYQWSYHLVDAVNVGLMWLLQRQAWCSLQVKLCDPCPSASEWFVYHGGLPYGCCSAVLQLLQFLSMI